LPKPVTLLPLPSPEIAKKAEAFRSETGIAVFQWDVADEAACAEGVKRVAGEVGPVDILVNNAGITRDGMFHKMESRHGPPC
jgi:acetoacetyl-CoA reductase